MSTNKQNSNRKATVASAAVIAALLFGGGGLTLANWSEQATTDTAAIQAGELSLTPGTAEWRDVSAAGGAVTTPETLDAIKAGTNITTAVTGKTFRTVPGDTLVRVQPVTPKLVGENLKAKLTLANKDGSAVNLPTGMTVEYKIIDKDGKVADGDASGVMATFVSDKFATAPGYAKGAEITADGSAVANVVTIFHFDVGTPDSVSENAIATLNDAGIKVEQVRD